MSFMKIKHGSALVVELFILLIGGGLLLYMAVKPASADASGPSEWSGDGAIAEGSAAAVAPVREVDIHETPSPLAEPDSHAAQHPAFKPGFDMADLQEAIELVRQMDPPGVACRDLRECLLCQLRYHRKAR